VAALRERGEDGEVVREEQGLEGIYIGRRRKGRGRDKVVRGGTRAAAINGGGEAVQ
jgi:hypothetical protein